jgi:predicted nucleic acid-binding protein
MVIDASITLNSILQGEECLPESRISTGVVPATWLSEVLNGLIAGERRGKLTAEALEDWRVALEELALQIEIEPPMIDRYFRDIVDVARRFRLSAYDASYLELAVRRGLPLATLDRRLRDAAVEAGVKILP